MAPESLWLVCGDRLVWGFGEGEHASGAGSLMSDLASTIGIPVTRTGDLARDVLDGCVDYDEAFLVSDEHGIVVSSNAAGPRSRRFAAGYQRLLDKSRDRSR